MSEITQRAEEVLDAVRAAEGIPEGCGVRLYGEQAADGSEGVGIALADSPFEGDAVTPQEPLDLFVAPEVTEELGEVVVDVTGQPGDPRLVVRSAPAEEAGSPGQ